MSFDAPEWALLALVLFFAVLIYMKVPRMVTGSLDSRAAAIQAELEAARKLRIEAEALLAEYKRKAATADSEARAIIDQATRAGVRVQTVRFPWADHAVNFQYHGVTNQAMVQIMFQHFCRNGGRCTADERQ